MVDVRCSTRSDGDFHLDHVPEVVLAHRRACLMAGTWSQPDEVHGATVLTVEAPGDHHRAIADGLVTRVPGAVLGIWVGDCAPVVLMSDRGALAAVHAGWRGLAGGIIATAAERLAGCGIVPLLRATFPFLLVTLATLVLVAAFPEISLWLPRSLGF